MSGAVQAGTLQRLDSRHRFASEPRRVLADLDFAGTFGARHPMIERLDEFTKRGDDFGRRGGTAGCPSITHLQGFNTVAAGSALRGDDDRAVT